MFQDTPLHLTNAQRRHGQAVTMALAKNQSQFTPLLGEPYRHTQPYVLNFTQQNSALATIDMQQPQQLWQYIQTMVRQHAATYALGNWGENRTIYQSSLFQHGDQEARSVHLAYDLWLEPGTPLYAPYPATILSAQNNDQFLDYGPTIILQHEINGLRFYSLYGHLRTDSLDDKQVGQVIVQGEQFAWVGADTENGHWAPHTHVQLITDMLGYSGDFPGVVRPSEQADYFTICPNPQWFISL